MMKGFRLSIAQQHFQSCDLIGDKYTCDLIGDKCTSAAIYANCKGRHIIKTHIQFPGAW